MKDTTLKRGEKKTFLALKVPRQFPLVLLVEVHLRKGKVVRSAESKILVCETCYEQPKNEVQ